MSRMVTVYLAETDEIHLNPPPGPAVRIKCGLSDLTGELVAWAHCVLDMQHCTGFYLHAEHIEELVRKRLAWRRAFGTMGMSDTP